MLSIVVPVYNVENYVGRCIESVINQTYKDLEIILVDDGSTDKSGIICDDYASRFSNIRVIHKQNEGLGFARNTGIKKAKGEYIAFLDSDDYLQTHHLATLYQTIKKHEAQVCYCGHTKINANGEKKEYPNSLAGKVYEMESIISEIVPRVCGKTGSYDDDIQMSACMALYKMSCIIEHGILFHSEREFVSEDLLFNLDFLAVAQKVVFCDSVGYMYWFNETSLTHRYLPKRFEKSIIMKDEVSKRMLALNIYSKCKQRILNTLVISARTCLQSEQFFAKVNGRRTAYDNFRKIVCNEELQKAIRSIDTKNIRLQARIINMLIASKQTIVLWNVMCIRNMMKI